MKLRILFALCFALLTSNTFGQLLPFSNTYEKYSQMWNISNVYYNVPTSTTLGQQKDTVINTTKYLWTSNFGKGLVNSDTFTPAPLTGYGAATFDIHVLKAATTSTVTPTVNIILQHSPNGTDWATISGGTFALSPTSKTVPKDTSVTINPIASRFFRWGVSTTDTISVKGSYFFKANYQLGNR